MPNRRIRRNRTENAPKRGTRETLREICNRNFNVVTLINLLVMTAYPLIFTFVYSFTDYNYLKGTENASFVLFDNYVSLFKNGYFQQAVWNTIKFTILAVVLEMALGLLIAVFVNSLKRGQKIMRTLLLLPYLLPAVTVALSWRMMLSANYGIINQFLKGLGLPVFNWFMDTKTAFGTILLIDVWQNVPFVFLLLYASLLAESELTPEQQAQAEALAAEIGGWAVQADVADPVQVGRMVDNVLDKYCQLDILICNAGIAQQKLFGDLTDDDWRRMFAVNVDGVFHAVRAALPHFIHRKAGRIVTVSSMWGQVGASCEVAYSAAKAGLIGLTKAVAKELAPKGITCNAVAPGFIETDMTRDLSGQDNGLLAAIPLGRMGQPQEVAEAVAFLATAPYITGEVLRVDGGIAM